MPVKPMARTMWALTFKGLNPAEKVVLTYLAQTADSKTYTCYPSAKTISENADIGEATVHRAIAQLVKKKALVYLKRPKGEGFKSNLYCLDLTFGGEKRPKKHTSNPEGKNKPAIILAPPNSIPGTVNYHPGTTILEPGSLTGLIEPGKTAFPNGNALDPDFLNKELGEIFPNLDYCAQNFEFKVEGLPNDFIPWQEGKVKLAEFLQESQVKLTPEQAIHKASKGGKSYTPLSLGVLWTDLCRIQYKGKFQAPLTMKQLGQISQANKKLAGENVDIGRVISHVVSDWLGFGKNLKNQGLLSDFPDYPHIGFFLKYLEQAVNFKPQGKPKVTGLKAYESS